MPYAGYRHFFEDKKDFLSGDQSKEAVENRVAAARYDFLLHNRHLLEQEFNDLFANLALIQDKKKFLLYCYYCALQLKTFYQIYDKHEEAQKYQRLARQLFSLIDQNKKELITAPQTDWQVLKKTLTDGFYDLLNTPLRASKIKKFAGLINLSRLQITFSRITIQQALLTARELHWVDKLNDLLNIKIDVDKMVGSLNQANDILNLLSVGLFAARFMVNGAMLLKHTVFASAKERQTSHFMSRFKAEFSKRDLDGFSDLSWAIVNLVTNYAKHFHIAPVTANMILLPFLLVDMTILFLRKIRAEKTYLEKKAQYCNEIRDNKHNSEYCELVQKQLQSLEDNWQATNAQFNFELVATVILMGGFSASMLLSFPAVLPVSFLFCVVAFAMYASAGEYAKYQQASSVCQRKELSGEDTEDALKDARKARNDFALVFAKNTMMPLLIMGTFAVCWQAALVLTALYVGYECLSGLKKAVDENREASKPLAF